MKVGQANLVARQSPALRNLVAQNEQESPWESVTDEPSPGSEELDQTFQYGFPGAYFLEYTRRAGVSPVPPLGREAPRGERYDDEQSADASTESALSLYGRFSFTTGSFTEAEWSPLDVREFTSRLPQASGDPRLRTFGEWAFQSHSDEHPGDDYDESPLDYTTHRHRCRTVKPAPGLAPAPPCGGTYSDLFGHRYAVPTQDELEDADR